MKETPMSDKWMTIDSAPKDGTAVLLTGGTMSIDEGRKHHSGIAHQYPASKDFPCVVGRWTDSAGKPVWRHGTYQGGYYSHYVEPTHWQPLPAPPAPKDASHD